MTRLKGMSSVAFAALVLWCAVLSVIDIRERRLPNALTGAGALGVLGYALYTAQFTAALVGAALLALPYLAVHLVTPTGFGAGDVKLAVGLGGAAMLGGARALALAAVAAPVLTALIGTILLIRRRVTGGAAPGPIPHGPAMCLATVSAILLVR
ncbi:prepilin peptidase [Nocardia arthritidis]|uniref:Prepilin peptidase n=2 Tax=Nocardia arthritidis TaxID=228602 RepID=A0A6G9YJU5_9NOCA|nr:prepilin peptidase [Nocardia arthritidis]